MGSGGRGPGECGRGAGCTGQPKPHPGALGWWGGCPSRHRENKDCPYFQHLPKPPSGSIICQKDLQNSLKSPRCGVLQGAESWGRMREGTKLLFSPLSLCTARSSPNYGDNTQRVGAPHPLPQKLTKPVAQSSTGVVTCSSPG